MYKFPFFTIFDINGMISQKEALDLNTCIKCHRPIADGDLFCEECAKKPLVQQSKPQKVRGGAFRKARTAAKETPNRPEKVPKPSRLPIILSVLLAVFVGVSIYFFATVTSQKVALRLREASVRAKEREYSELTGQISDLETKISSLEDEISQKNEQIESLTHSVSEAESSASQTELNVKTQQTELKKAQSAYDALKEEHQALEDEYAALKESVSQLEKKAGFLDQYVVFVENNGTGYYHKYGCADFAKKTFWAYSRKLAEDSGFTACPHCIK